MRIILSFLILSIFLHSCDQNNTIIESDFEQDSLKIIQNFEHALLHPDSFEYLKDQNLSLVAKNKKLDDTYLYNLSEYYINTLEYEIATYYIYQGLSLYTDTLHSNTAKFYNLLAIKAMYSSDVDSSIYYTNKAIQIFERDGQEIPAGVMYVNISDVFNVKSDFISSYEYVTKGLALLEKNNDTLYLPSAYAMMSIAILNYHKNVDSAIYYNNKAVALAEKLNNPYHKASAIISRGEIYSFEKKWREAIVTFEDAIKLCEENNLDELTLKLYNNLSFVYTQIGNYPKSLSHLRKLSGLIDEKNLSLIYDMHLSFVHLFEKMNMYDSAFHYLKKAEYEYRQIANEKNQKQVQYLLISYEDQKKTAQIADQAQTISRALIVLIILGIIVFTLFLIIYVGGKLRKAKARIAEERHKMDIMISMAEGEERERKRIAHDLHNGVAAQLTGIKFNLESLQQQAPAVSDIVNQVIKAHKEIRSIAHNLNPIDFNNVSLFDAITSFVNDINIVTDKIHLYVGVQDCIIPAQKAKVIYRLVQEFVQNALKYSNSDYIYVNCISLQDGKCQITIEDEGIGFDVGIMREKYKQTIETLFKPLDIIVVGNSQPGEGSIMTIQF